MQAATADNLSRAERFAFLSERERRAFLASLTPRQREVLRYNWPFWARPKQLAPRGEWDTWLILAGRGFGKTRTGAEFVRTEVEAGRAGRIALAGPTAADVRDTMIEGESGILRISPPHFRPKYEPSKRRLTWPNGAIATAFSADEPDRFRGPQHDLGWCDELAAWKYADAWDQYQLGLRLGKHPRTAVTTTPRPTPLIKKLIAQQGKGVILTTGTTYENLKHLAPAFRRAVVEKYEGTRLGRQELNAEILDDVPGALWTRKQLDFLRVDTHPQLSRSVVAVDPSVSTNGEACEVGIVVAGLGMCACKGTPELHGFVIDDLSEHLSPAAWAKRAVGAYKTQKADRIVAEANNGGALVEVNIRTEDRNAAYKAVHAAQGKRTRAEPVAALYEQGKVHHVGAFAKLEDQMVTWNPLIGDASPDRMDALVWALTELMLEGREPTAAHTSIRGVMPRRV